MSPVRRIEHRFPHWLKVLLNFWRKNAGDRGDRA